MTKKIKEILFWVLAVLLLFMLAAASVVVIYLRGDTYEPLSWQRKTIWLCKRVIAETAALPLKVWDPYAERTVRTFNGPESTPGNLPDVQPLDSQTSLLAWLARETDTGGVRVDTFRNGELPDSRFAFGYQIAAEPSLDSLRSIYCLDTLAARTLNDYELLCRVSDWLHRYFLSLSGPALGLKRVDYNFNALDILFRVSHGERFWCSEYSTSLVQCQAALGITARYVMLISPTGGHVTVETWSDVWGKWVMIDPFFGRRVTLDGVPLNVYEIHRLPFDPEALSRVRVEQFDGRQVSAEERRFYLSLYRTFAVRMRNDWFTNRYPHWYPLSNSVMNAVEWQDSLTFNNIYYKYETERVQDLYWPLNEVHLELYPLGRDSFRVALRTFTPNFACFELRMDSSDFSPLERPVFDWRLHPGQNSLRVRAVNSFGRRGQEEIVSVNLGDR